jgi:type 2 lantibiotic biosynthesis protein LanM
VDVFFERLIVHAASIDELLSDDFEALPGQKGDADRAARRLAAWSRASASGDWSLFARRLERDRLSIGQMLAKFATVRRAACASAPAWIDDAIWIEAALHGPRKERDAIVPGDPAEPCAFEHLFAPVVEHAESLLWAGVDSRACNNLNDSARACLRHALLKEVCNLSAPALYERFANARKAGATSADASETQRDGSTPQYDRFIADMKGGGFRRLFEDKPVLLRLLATITRQWIDTSREFVMRLDSDLATIRHDLLHSGAGRVANIEGDLSDPHNGGHSVLIVCLEDGTRVVYKPKDLRLDAAWHTLVERLNRGGAPVELKAVQAIARDGYGWTAFIHHAGCADEKDCRRFFRRAGAWLALFHCFAGSDMHQENMIAAGEHPVPIDLEMLLQVTAAERRTGEIEAQAFEAAAEIVDNSVLRVGLLPAYGRSPGNKIFAIGGMVSDLNSGTNLSWNDINSDTMRPAKTKQAGATIPNLPHIDGRYAKFGDHIDDFVAGFEDYARFLLSRSRDADPDELLDGFAGLAVRKVVRPTRFYYMLLQRLRNHRSMDDGVTWSAQADFLARLADGDRDSDPLWPLQRAERAALLALNVPHFVSPRDGDEIRDASGTSIRSKAVSGLDRARARVRSFNEPDIAWQVEVIRQNTAAVSRSDDPGLDASRGSRVLRTGAPIAPSRETFIA